MSVLNQEDINFIKDIIKNFNVQGNLQTLEEYVKKSKDIIEKLEKLVEKK